jgi:hypothetical protein
MMYLALAMRDAAICQSCNRVVVVVVVAGQP